MTDRRSLWFTAIFVSLFLNGLFLWVVQALTFSEAPQETKRYFPVALVRLDTPPALEIIKPQSQTPVSRLPPPPKPIPKSTPKPETPPSAINRNISQELPPQEVPAPQETEYSESATKEIEQVTSAPASSGSPNETSGSGGGYASNQTGGEPGGSGTSFVPINRLTKVPTFLQRVEPVYPENERLLGKETIVLAEIDLDEKGSIAEIRIIKSGGKPFDTAVENALKKSRLTPGYVKDRAVPIQVQIPFAFRLK